MHSLLSTAPRGQRAAVAGGGATSSGGGGAGGGGGIDPRGRKITVRSYRCLFTSSARRLGGCLAAASPPPAPPASLMHEDTHSLPLLYFACLLFLPLPWPPPSVSSACFFSLFLVLGFFFFASCLLRWSRPRACFAQQGSNAAAASSAPLWFTDPPRAAAPS